MLELREATIGYGSASLIESSSMCLSPGEIKGFIAPNGYGKTTLMRVLAGEARGLKGGRVAIDGVGMPRRFVSRDVFYMPGDASMLYGHLSAADHLCMVKDLWQSPYNMAEVMAKCGVDGFAGKPLRVLSQGMKQQVSIACALASGARYVLLDEPMNALDPLNVERFAELVRGAARHGAGVLISSHYLSNIDELCHAAITIADRQLEETGFEGADAKGLFRDKYRRLVNG